VDFEIDTGVGWDSLRLDWTLKATVKVTRTWGTELAGPTAILYTGCDTEPLACKNTSGPSSELVHLLTGVSFTRTFTQQATGGPAQFPDADLGLGGILGLVLDVTPIAIPDDKILFEDGEFNGTYGYCDNVIAPAGCINPTEYSFVIYDSRSTSYPKVAPVAQHVYDSQQPGVLGLPSKWGRPGIGYTVTRTTSDIKIKANRAVSCPVSPADPLLTCDEFSLASTNEGAAYVAPNDWSSRDVPKSANDSQGGLNSTYNQAYRIADGDEFYILAILPDGRDSWST
jgi:hypothetical protein